MGAVVQLRAQLLGHAELATAQIYASALSARRRAAVMARDFGASGRNLDSAASRGRLTPTNGLHT